jgi:hypothetical protein
MMLSDRQRLILACEEDEDRVLNRLKLPDGVLAGGSTRKAFKRRFDARVKLSAFEACDEQCFYCNTSIRPVKGRLTWHCDHLTPSSLGGSDKLDNAVAACVPCNTAKRDLFHEQFVLNVVTKARLAALSAPRVCTVRCHAMTEGGKRCKNVAVSAKDLLKSSVDQIKAFPLDSAGLKCWLHRGD